MEILGIGPLEFIFILLIALIVVGPKGMVNLAQKTAEWLRKLRKSEIWSTTREVMDMPNQIMKETGLEKELREIKAMTTPPSANEIWQSSMLHNTTRDPDTNQQENVEEPKISSSSENQDDPS